MKFSTVLALCASIAVAPAVHADEMETAQTKVNAICAKFVADHPLEGADLSGLMHLMLTGGAAMQMGGMRPPMGGSPMGGSPMGGSPMGGSPMGGMRPPMGGQGQMGMPPMPGFGGRRLLQLLQQPRGAPPTEGASDTATDPFSGMIDAINGMMGPLMAMMAPKGVPPCDDELALQLLCYGEDAVMQKLVGMLPAGVNPSAAPPPTRPAPPAAGAAGAQAGAATNTNVRPGRRLLQTPQLRGVTPVPVLTSAAPERAAAAAEIDVTAVASTCFTRQRMAEFTANMGQGGPMGGMPFGGPAMGPGPAGVPPTRPNMMGRRLFQMPTGGRPPAGGMNGAMPPGAQNGAMPPGAQNLRPEARGTTGATGNAPCADDADGILASFQMTCAKDMINLGQGCSEDVSAYSDRVPRGTTVAHLCPVTCKTCPEDFAAAAAKCKPFQTSTDELCAAVKDVMGQIIQDSPFPSGPGPVNCPPVNEPAAHHFVVGAGLKQKKQSYCLVDGGDQAQLAVCGGDKQVFEFAPAFATDKIYLKTKDGRCVLQAGKIGACVDTAQFTIKKNGVDPNFFYLINSGGKCMSANLSKGIMSIIACADHATKKSLGQLWTIQLPDGMF